METERYQLVAELQAKSRKLEEARGGGWTGSGPAADAAEARAADAERERDRAVVTIEGLTSELDAMRETVRASSVDAGGRGREARRRGVSSGKRRAGTGGCPRRRRRRP
jgi:hypothetical protein